MPAIFISHSSKDVKQTKQMKLWLAEQGYGRVFLDFDKDTGVDVGEHWERRLYREINRCEAMILILTSNWLASKYCFAEFTQARALGKAIFPVIENPTGDSLVTPDIQHLDLRVDRERGLSQLARALDEISRAAQRGFAWDGTRSPFPGFDAFEEDDAAIFFGRDDEIRHVNERLNSHRTHGGAGLIILLGASGSGKSSLLRAGVIPRLKRQRSHWLILPPLRPRGDPIGELAVSISTALGVPADWREWRTRLVEQPEAVLHDLSRDMRIAYSAPDAYILIPIDQAEELFSISATHESEQFFKVISQAVADDHSILAIATLPSAFLDNLQTVGSLSASFELVFLETMPLERFRQVIEGPAKVAGLSIGEGLVDAAQADAKTRDALPLLAFTLQRLYEYSGDSGCLSLESYENLGDKSLRLSPLQNTVRVVADEAIAAASPTDNELAALRNAFIPAMVRVNSEGDYVRRPALLSDLPDDAKRLIQKLVRARLLTMYGDGANVSIEVTHEALLRHWPLLRAWLDEQREFIIAKESLERSLLDWRATPASEKESALLTGLSLNRAREWLRDQPQQLTSDEKLYITASITADDARVEAESHRMQRLRRVTGVGYILPARQALREGKYDKALRLIASAVLLADDPRLEILPELYEVATNSVVNIRSITIANHEAVVTCLAFSNDGLKFITGSSDQSAKIWCVKSGACLTHIIGHEEGINCVDLSDDGQFALTASGDNWSYHDSSIRIWTTDTAKQTLHINNTNCIVHAQFCADASRVLFVDNLGSVSILSLESGQKLLDVGVRGTYPPIIEHGARTPWGASRKGRYGFVIQDSSLHILELESGGNFKISLEGMGNIVCAALTTNGEYLASADKEGKIYFLKVPQGDKLYSLASSVGEIRCLSFSGDGKFLLAEGKTAVEILDTSTFEKIRILQPNSGALKVNNTLAGTLPSAILSPAGSWIIFRTEDGALELWDVETGTEICKVDHGISNTGSPSLVEFSPDECWFATAIDAQCHVWDSKTGKEIVKLTGHELPITCLAISPDCTQVLTGAKDGTARLWSIKHLIRQVSALELTGEACPVLATSSSGAIVTIAKDDQHLILSVPGYEEIGKIPTASYTFIALHISDQVFLGLDSGGTIRRWMRHDNNRWVQDNETIKIDPPARDRGFFRLTEELPLIAAFSPDGRTIAICRGLRTSFVYVHHVKDDEARAHVFDTSTGRKICDTPPHHDWITSITYSPDGKYVATTSGSIYDLSSYSIRWDDSVRVCDALTGDEITTVTNFDFIVTGCSFSHCGRYIATCGERDLAQICELNNGSPIVTLHNTAALRSIQFAPNGKYVAGVTYSGEIIFLDTLYGTEICKLPQSVESFDRLFFCTNGAYIVANSKESFSTLWSTRFLDILADENRLAGVFAVMRNGLGRVGSLEKSDIMFAELPDNLYIAAIEQWPELLSSFETAADSLNFSD